MVQEVSGRLYGTVASELPAKDLQVWAEAAAFLNTRIQGPEDWSENPNEHQDRPADMSLAAKVALRKALGQLEAVLMLMSNREKVVKDITNSGPNGLNGGQLTQLGLKRVDSKYAASVDKMVAAVCGLLLGKGVPGPSTPEEAMAWQQAAIFLSGRVQGSADACPGRARDMSSYAAKEMRAVLAQIEAFGKLMSNRETVVKDITNPGPRGVNGGQLTQTHLKRLDGTHQIHVDAMVKEVCNRLLGNKISEPTSEQVQVWGEAARFFAGRFQTSPGQCPGREADMSYAAAQAMNTVLAQITSKSAAAHSLGGIVESICGDSGEFAIVSASEQTGVEAGCKLLVSIDKVVRDITNPGPLAFLGGHLTQLDLKRVDPKNTPVVRAMVCAVCYNLLGQQMTGPSTPEEAVVWTQAAKFLGTRIQATEGACPGRAADMPPAQAAAMRAVLGRIEAASKQN
eukprot:gnl/TRDRNA2_/TRDRNA2_175933_c0_seq1.p1 gnl/TRDRNA2_/TRDRNA2_175933_c0~~gnl/TRDRNA2_/TRDRNA2_175933_c0_seq1.p1  ORF type:complete len:477 (-),score=88.04 gnl/TRDRNA2_/TRDRNA2_175933_c0_seq1:16-1380(-)